jgi:hypothetical protein
MAIDWDYFYTKTKECSENLKKQADEECTSCSCKEETTNQ